MSLKWTDERLGDLPVRNGVRQRGVDMTRLETFCDAAFAFAVTLLVIGEGIPRSYAELVLALKGVPAFAASFAAIAAFWWSHRTWSRRYGLEDGVTSVISLTMVFIMLVYVYPLKMVFTAFAHWTSGGFLPAEFTLDNPRDMLGIFQIYGLGFAAQTGMLALLHLRVLRVAGDLRLDAVERLRTRQGIVLNIILGATGLVSALWAMAMPPAMGRWAGFVYMTLPLTMPLAATRFKRAVARLQAPEDP
ncbi:MAG: DUF1211 domain-containing protein [bacterium]|nr:DUF1211 domain-containing protein [bacterium]